jgi:transposase-like protein
MDEFFCPRCGEEGSLKYIGLDKDGNEVYFCPECESYWVIKELEPPFEITIDKKTGEE